MSPFTNAVRDDIMLKHAKRMRTALAAVALVLVSQGAQAQIGLQIERSASGSVAQGANAIADSIVYSAGNISYNPATGVITFNESGRFLLNWWVAYQLVDAANTTATLALSSSQGDFLEGNSVSPSGQVVGMGIIEVAAAPVTLSLVNASAGTLYFAAAAPVKMTLIVTQQLPPATPPP